MTGKINLNKVSPAPQLQPQVSKSNGGKSTPQGPSFQEVLQDKVASGGVRFSQHAQQRLQRRNIGLAPQQLERLNQAVEKAASKGAKESLVLMNDVAFIVSVQNRTVVTAVDGRSLKENVFTNIDSAVII